MKWLIAFVALTGIGALVYFYILFQGPRMRVQPHVRAYQESMPLPPDGIVPVEPDRYEVPGVEQASGMKNPVADTQAARDRGKVYYDYYCVFCHGENGQGDGPVGYSYMPAPTDLHAPKIREMSDGDLLRRMLTGVGHDPVLRRVVAPGHRWYIVRYVRFLGGKPRVPAENQGEHVILRDAQTR